MKVWQPRSPTPRLNGVLGLGEELRLGLDLDFQLERELGLGLGLQLACKLFLGLEVRLVLFH